MYFFLLRNSNAVAFVKEKYIEIESTIWPTFQSSRPNRLQLFCTLALRDTKQINNRKDDVLLARLKFGHHPSLKQYLHHRLDPSQDPICPNCHLEEKDLHHWLCECPASITMRLRVFGFHQGSLEWLATRPGDVVAYARKTLVNLDA